MKMSKIGVGASVLAMGLMASGSAIAQSTDDTMMMDSAVRGWYLSGNIGIHHPMDSDLSGTGVSSSAEIDQGLAGLAAFGFDFGEHWRAEFETGYRESDLDNISGTAATGDAEALSGIANVFYDFNLGGGIEPYLGAGLGMTRVSLDGASPIGGSSITDDDWGFALQAGAGLAIPLNRRLKLTADYRYMSVRDLNYTSAAGTSIDADYDDHAVFIGLRFALNPPPPAPKPVVQAVAPAPTPAPPPPAAPIVRDFIVFFDFDSAALTPQAQGILREAVANAKRAGNSRIVATGHADRSGSAAYNVGLSQQRADAVRGELIRLGMTTNDIQTVARGETDPLVATPDGVREPQNRRVQIVLN